MPNLYFQFKQFTVFHDKCAMKVTTDACLFGAWVASEIAGTDIKKALDIGAGTGLLSLMAAQQTPAFMDAVELSPGAAQQARENIAASPWPHRIAVHEADILQFDGGHYDVIFSNPPFYEAELTANNAVKNMARHAEGLRLEPLLDKAGTLLDKHGDLFLLLPFKRAAEIEKLLHQKAWHLLQWIEVHPTPAHPAFRLLVHVSKQPRLETRRQTVHIKNAEGAYTAFFEQLLKEYYLFL